MVKFGRSKAEQCAKEIINFLISHEMWVDTCVYANNKRFGCKDDTGHYHYDNNLDCVFVEENMDPHRYLTYAGDFLSMSFEGPFYEVINYYENAKYCDKLITEFSEIIDKYGYYFELGEAWNLSLYKR